MAVVLNSVHGRKALLLQSSYVGEGEVHEGLKSLWNRAVHVKRKQMDRLPLGQFRRLKDVQMGFET